MRHPSTPLPTPYGRGLRRAGLRPSSLRVRLLVLVLLAIVPLLGLILYNAAERRALAADRAHTDALQIARLAASTQAQFIEQARQMLVSLAERPELRAAGLPACSAVFSSLQTQYLGNAPRYANLGLIDASGKVFCSVVTVSGPVDVSGQTYFENAVQTLSFSLGDYQIDRAKGQTVLNVGYPVLDFNGRVRLVLFASLDLGWLNQLASQAQLPPGSTFTVADRQGKILIRYPGGVPLIGDTLDTLLLGAIQAQPGGGAVEANDADGVPRLYGFSPLSTGAGPRQAQATASDTSAATVSIGIPAREAFAEGNAILLRSLATLGLVALLALGVAWIAGDRFILRPVQALVHATRRLSAGDLAARSGLSRAGRQGEIGQLAHVFDQMAESLERREIERRHAESALRESEERYRTLARNFPNGAVILFDHGLRYTLADGAGLADTGLSREMLEGRTIWEVFAPDTCEILEPHYRAALAGTPNVFEIPFADRIYQVNTLPVKNESGEIVAGMVMTQDITERKQAYQVLEQRVEERTHELSTLLQVARDVTSTLDLEPLLGVILDQLKSVVDYTGASVLIVEGDLVRYGAYRGPAPMEAVLHIQFPLEGSLTKQIVADRQPAIVPDVREDTAQTRAMAKSQRERTDGAFSYIRAWLGVPLIVKEKALGVLSLHHSQPGHFTPRHAELAMAFASHAAIAMENERLFGTEQRRAEQFRVLSDVGQRITSILDVDEILSHTVKLIRETFGRSAYHVHVGLIQKDLVTYKAGAGVWRDEADCQCCNSLALKVGQDGLTGLAAGDGVPILARDVTQDPRYLPSYDNPSGSEMVIPLKVKGRVIGVLNVESERVDAFDDSDVAVLQSLANQLAVAIENARLFETEQRRAEQFRAISEVGRHITSILSVDDLMSQTVQRVRERFGYYFASIGLVDAAAGQVVVRYGDPLRLKIGEEGVMGWVAATGEPLLVPDVLNDDRYVASPSARQTRSELAVPIMSRGQVIGILDAESDRVDGFDASDLTVLQALANQLAVAIENARLYEQAQQLAALEERQKLARELHDSVSQALYGIALGGRTARTLLDRDPGKVAEPLDYVLSLAEAGLAEMRALIFELRPESLELEGLVAALSKQTASLRARHTIDVRTALVDEPALPLAAKEAMYRIAQEALNNIVKHAHATKVDVRLEISDGVVRLEIGDNGVGFDPQGEFPGHLGLRSMRERAEKAGGAFSVESAEGQGTRIRVQFPYHSSE